MTLPELDVARVQRWCRARVPERVRDQVRVEVDVAPRHRTIVECRPPWRADVGPNWTRHPIARFRYTRSTGQWSLYWRDRNLRFHEYDRVAPTDRLEELLMELDLDPTAIFWGSVRLRSSGLGTHRSRLRVIAVEVTVKQVGGPGPVQSLPGSVVDLVGDLGELFGGDCAQVRALGEVVAQQAVGVLVAASLPR